jgi:glycosyltransferase involved in cell wall biosynthesis
MVRPLVSILLPSLNAYQFLEERIESLLTQSFSNWEAIVLDSHSSDGSWEFFKSIASTDSRFRLYQIPRDGLYAALNRGMQLASGEFLHIATCDDTMVPGFLTDMLKAYAQCPRAGIAVCDLLFIDRNGDELSPADLIGHFTVRATKDLLSLDTVRTSVPGEICRHLNYRPAPHDCLLHFAGRSVYCSLTQLVVRMSSVKAVAPFETKIGSIADYEWLLRLTAHAGSVHLPRKLAMWRYHGSQLSLHRDDSRLRSMRVTGERTLRGICERQPHLLTRNDCEALLLPYKILMARSAIGRVYRWFEAAIRLLWMVFDRPAATWRGLRRAKFRFGTRRYSLLPMILQGIGLAPSELNVIRKRFTASQDGPCISAEETCYVDEGPNK